VSNITNYYEKLVYDRIYKKLKGSRLTRDEDYVADVACVALNKLPARYVRHMVDTRFFETEEEQHAADLAVERAVVAALAFINEREGLSPDGTAHARFGTAT
jgi:competence protein ComFB